MIREVRVDSDAALMPELRRLYETAFPVEEQIPYHDLVRLLPVMPIAYSAWYAGDSFVGLTLVCECKGGKTKCDKTYDGINQRKCL